MPSLEYTVTPTGAARWAPNLVREQRHAPKSTSPPRPVPRTARHTVAARAVLIASVAKIAKPAVALGNQVLPRCMVRHLIPCRTSGHTMLDEDGTTTSLESIKVKKPSNPVRHLAKNAHATQHFAARSLGYQTFVTHDAGQGRFTHPGLGPNLVEADFAFLVLQPLSDLQRRNPLIQLYPMGGCISL